MPEWYVLRVASNKEERIRKNLQARIAETGMENLITNVMVPVQKVPEIINNQRRIMKKKMYPGYIMVEMDVTEDSMNLLESIPGISDFLGPRGKPTPMDPVEVERVLLLMNSDEESPVAPKIELEVGDKVRVNEGPFKDYTGEIREISPTKGKVKVLVSNVFNYANVEMEMEYWHVEAFQEKDQE